MNSFLLKKTNHWNINLFNSNGNNYLNKNKLNYCFDKKKEDFEFVGFTIDTSTLIYSKRVDELFDFTRGFLDNLQKKKKNFHVKKKKLNMFYNHMNHNKLNKFNINWKDNFIKFSKFLTLKKNLTYTYKNNYFLNSFILKSRSIFNFLELKLIIFQKEKEYFKLVNSLNETNLKNFNFLNYLLIYQKQLQAKQIKILQIKMIVFLNKKSDFNNLDFNNLNIFEKKNKIYQNDHIFFNFESLINEENFSKLKSVYNKKILVLNQKKIVYEKYKKKIFFYEKKKKLNSNYVQIGFLQKYKFQKKKKFFKLKNKSYVWILEKKLIKNFNKNKSYTSKFFFPNKLVSNLELKERNHKKEESVSNLFINSNISIKNKFFYFNKLHIFFSNYYIKFIKVLYPRLKFNCYYIFFDFHIFFYWKINYFDINNNFKKNLYIILLNYVKYFNHSNICFLNSTCLKKFFLLKQ
jgi:hypothetical protein